MIFIGEDRDDRRRDDKDDRDDRRRDDRDDRRRGDDDRDDRRRDRSESGTFTTFSTHKKCQNNIQTSILLKNICVFTFSILC